MNEDIQTTASLDSGKLIVARSADVTPFIENVKKIKSTTNGKSKTGEMYHLGQIPSIVIEQYMNKVGINYNEFLTDNIHINRILNDPDYAMFRIWEGRV